MKPNKSQNNRSRKNRKQQPQDTFRGPTRLPGQNPRVHDEPSHDEHHDENRLP